MILTLPDSFFFFFFLGSSPFCLSLWFCALVIWPSRLYSHCEAEEQKDGSNSFCATPQARLFFPSAHYLQTRLRVSAGHHRSLPLWPRPTILQGAEVSGRPTLDFVSATRNHPRHSTPPPGKLQKKKMAASQSVRLGRQRLVPFLFIQNKLTPPKKYTSLPAGTPVTGLKCS